MSVKDFTGKVVGAIGISGPIWRLTDQVLKEHSKIVQGAAERLSAEFGARPRPDVNTGSRKDTAAK